MELQQQLADGYHPPIIFLTGGHGDIPTRPEWLGQKIECSRLDGTEQLRHLVHAAFAQDYERRTKQTELDSLHRCFQLLTPREREVLPLVVSGLLNKQAAAHLGISEITLQIHRTNVMRKMQAGSLAELVRIADALEIPVSSVRRLRPSVRLEPTTVDWGLA
jgi:DNA-binding CsgD family transcriptional regulator